MCGCADKNSVDLPTAKQHINLYLTMAIYEVKKEWLGKGVSTQLSNGGLNNLVIGWDNASQEDLARAYEEFSGGQSFINKIEKSSEKTSKAKKPSKDKGDLKK